MKALVYFGPYDIRYTDVETPEPQSEEVLIKVKAVSICGSDLSGYKGESAMRVPPLIMGHEFSGEIAKLGEGVRGFAIGDRVVAVTNLFCGCCAHCENGLTNVCDNRKIIGTTMPAGSYHGAMADYVVAPAEKMVLLPGHLSFNEAALIEPLAISLRAVKHAGNLTGKTVAVYGAGPIGLLAIQCIKNAGAERIVAIEHCNDTRLEMAIKCGATDILNEKDDILARTREITNRAGVDVVFDAVGVPATVNGGVDIVRNGGTIIWIGLAAPKVEFDYKHAVCKEITFQSTYMYTTEMDESLELLKSRKINAAQIITGIYPMREGAKIFGEIAQCITKDIKIILSNW
jgi:2-desacetyl-2-hydroxyethyl bacteriochlorophyllide A dehydrogenase